MNIGFFYSNFEYPPTSGSGVHGYQLVKHLTALGHRVGSFYFGGTNPAIRHFRGRQLVDFLRWCDVFYIRTDVRYRLELFTLLKLLAAGRRPVVWEVNSPPVERAFETQYGQNFAVLERRRRLLARLVDAAVVVSKPVYDYARDTLRIRRVTLVPNGSDPEQFSPSRRRPSCYPKPFNVVWIGSTRFTWHGIGKILDAAAVLTESDPDVGVVLIGDRSFLPATLPANVTCIGELAHPEVPPYLASADVGLVVYQGFDQVPGGFYGSPTKLYDCLASGLAVVAHDVGQVGEVIQDGVNGLLCDGTVEQVVAGIRRLKADPDLRGRLGVAARQTVEQSYNWRRVGEQTDRLLREVVS